MGEQAVGVAIDIHRVPAHRRLADGIHQGVEGRAWPVGIFLRTDDVCAARADVFGHDVAPLLVGGFIAETMGVVREHLDGIGRHFVRNIDGEIRAQTHATGCQTYHGHIPEATRQQQHKHSRHHHCGHEKRETESQHSCPGPTRRRHEGGCRTTPQKDDGHAREADDKTGQRTGCAHRRKDKVDGQLLFGSG